MIRERRTVSNAYEFGVSNRRQQLDKYAFVCVRLTPVRSAIVLVCWDSVCRPQQSLGKWSGVRGTMYGVYLDWFKHIGAKARIDHISLPADPDKYTHKRTHAHRHTCTQTETKTETIDPLYFKRHHGQIKHPRERCNGERGDMMGFPGVFSDVLYFATTFIATPDG